MVKFASGEKVNFYKGNDGKSYILQEGSIPEHMKGIIAEPLGSAVIDRVDYETKTIWFVSPIPEGISC